MDDVLASSGNQVGLRACDQCRMRKIRCDKGRPCASCRASDLPCQASGVRPKEQRQRVLISSVYESKIDSITDRLAGIEEALRELRTSSPSPSAHANQPQPSSVPVLKGPSITVTPGRTPPSHVRHFEGTSSLSAHATHMNDHLQQVLRNTQLSYQDADLAAALASLSQLVSGKNTYPGEVDLPTYSIEVLDKHKYEIPPAEIVSQVLREVEDIYDTVVGLFYPIRAYKDAVALCKDLYFNIEDVPVSRLIVTFGTMYYIFEFYQYSLSADDPRHAQYAHYTTSFARNMMDLLGHLNLLMPPSDDNVEALMLTAYYSIAASRPSLCSTLVSKAANLCFALGYHRADTMTEDSPDVRERKIRLFWLLYVLDRGLCLRIGRAPVIQDYDIAVPLPSRGSNDTDRAGKNIVRFWIGLSEVQGRVYEDLYSPRALRQPRASRAQQAEALAVELRKIWAEHDTFGHVTGTTEETHRMFMMADKVTLSTTLTLILRAVPMAENQSLLCSHECVAAARHAMQLHHICALEYGKAVDNNVFSEYLHWTLLHTPFTPFLVIFSHTIETQSVEDLKLLGDFAETLRPAQGISSGIDKMYLVCDVFHRVAKLFLEASARSSAFATPTSATDSTQLRRDLDPFMARIGINYAYDAEGSDGAYGYSNPTCADPSQTFNAFALQGNMGEWFSEGQLITALLGDNRTFMEPLAMQAKDDGRLI